MPRTYRKPHGPSTKEASAARKWGRARKKNVKSPLGIKDDGGLEEDFDREISSRIEQFLAEEKWPEARALIEQELKKTPRSHWLWTMLGETHYEERQYKTALKYAKKSLALKPNCPLVLFNYAGTLEMLCRFEEALATYKKILDREVESVAYDECGEGLKWAMQLMNDCHYRMGRCYLYLDDKKSAQVSFRKYLHNRAHGVRSIYKKKKAEALLTEASS